MTSAFSDRFSATGSPLGLRFSGETVVRRPAGNAGAAANQTARVMLVDTTETDNRATVYDAVITVAETDTVLAEDVYQIRGQEYFVRNVEVPSNGEKVANLRRVKGNRTEARAGRNVK